MPFFLRLLALTCALIGSAAAVETQLQVTATDDNLPTNRLTYTWTVRTSPQAATGANAAQISTPTSANSRVVLSVAGTYVFRVEVSDGHLTTTGDVTVVVNPPTSNTEPIISLIEDQLIARNQATGLIEYTITDTGGISRVEWETSNALLVPGSAVELGENGAKRTIKITPARDQSGTATITVKVTDVGGLVTRRSFKLTVNVPPTITKISATQTTLTLP